MGVGKLLASPAVIPTRILIPESRGEARMGLGIIRAPLREGGLVPHGLANIKTQQISSKIRATRRRPWE